MMNAKSFVVYTIKGLVCYKQKTSHMRKNVLCMNKNFNKSQRSHFHLCLDIISKFHALEEKSYHTLRQGSTDISKQQQNKPRCPLTGTIKLVSTSGEQINLVIHKVLGMGTGSVVYLGEIDGSQCVAKQLYPELLNNEALIEGTSHGLTVCGSVRAQKRWRQRKNEFLKSFKMQGKLSSIPSLAGFIQPVCGIYLSGDTICMISKSFVGYSWEKQQDCSIDELIEIIIKIAHVVQCINEYGFLVVDIKPSNFVVSVDSNRSVVVDLIDFGSIAKRHSWEKYKYSSETAPKEYKSKHRKNVGTWSEVYCVVAMFTDRLFGHHNTKIIHGDLSAICKSKYREWVYKHQSILEYIIIRGLDDNISTRFQTCKDLIYYMNMLR